MDRHLHLPGARLGATPPRPRSTPLESWLGLMWARPEVEALPACRGAVVFGRSHGSITLSKGGSVATKT